MLVNASIVEDWWRTKRLPVLAVGIELTTSGSHRRNEGRA